MVELGQEDRDVARFIVHHLDWANTFALISGHPVHALPSLSDSVYVDRRPITKPVSKPLTADMLLAGLEEIRRTPARCDVFINSLDWKEVQETCDAACERT